MWQIRSMFINTVSILDSWPKVTQIVAIAIYKISSAHLNNLYLDIELRLFLSLSAVLLFLLALPLILDRGFVLSRVGISDSLFLAVFMV